LQKCCQTHLRKKIMWKRYKNTSYLISDIGEVYSEIQHKILTPSDDTKGYLKVTLWIDGVQSTEKVHRLVAMVFLEESETKLEVNHIDGNKRNNSSTNLEWVSHQENITHAMLLGLMSIGSSHPISKLDEEAVLLIKQLFVAGLSNQEIANRFGVARGTISKIRDGKTWKHVSPDMVWDNTFKRDKKLNAEDIPKIRELHKAGISLNEIGRQFGVHSGSISSVIGGKSWKNY
jgi:hypothetical protein